MAEVLQFERMVTFLFRLPIFFLPKLIDFSSFWKRALVRPSTFFARIAGDPNGFMGFKRVMETKTL